MLLHSTMNLIFSLFTTYVETKKCISNHSFERFNTKNSKLNSALLLPKYIPIIHTKYVVGILCTEPFVAEKSGGNPTLVLR